MHYVSRMELEWQRGTVQSAGEDIYWELTSVGSDDDRPVVVLSHGAGGTHAVWYQQVPLLGEHFRIVTWDSRGFGNSSNRTDAPGAEAAAGDMSNVLDYLQIDAAHLVGQSMGGWHSVAFAAAHGDRVHSLTLADSVGGLWTDELRDALAVFQSTGGLSGPARELVGGHPALWFGTANRDRSHAFLYQSLGSFHTPPMAKLGATLSWTLAHAEIASLGVPVLFLAGEHDAIFPAASLRRSSELIDGAQYVEIPDAGHSPYFEQPEAWNQAVLSFLQSAVA